jgi:hypothetical protein
MIALVALLSSAIFRTTAAPAPTPQSADQPKKPQAPHAQPAGDDVTALDLLADSLGVDISPDGLKRRTQRALRTLSTPRTHDELTSDVRFLWAILQAVPDDTLDIGTARSSLKTFADTQQIELAAVDDTSQASTNPLPVDVSAFLTKYINAAATSDAFERLDSAKLRREVLRLAAKDLGIRVRFLIATLPDPVDSFTGWQFDPMLDAITQAVSASDYTLDRFYLPDAGGDLSGNQTVSAHDQAHEDQPGFLIFRKHAHHDEPATAGAHEKPLSDTSERLVLQLVFETPTAGVHVRALAKAVRLAARWYESEQTADRCGAGNGEDVSCIRILGPTFSGTVESMAHAIDMAKSALGKQQVWIVSGSATDPSNGMTLKTVRPERLRYQVTVQPDDVLVHSLLDHMVRIDWSGRIAVLFEGNTQYGRQIRERVRDENASRALTTGPVFPSVLNVPFPMNISRLRREARSDQPAIDRALGMPSKFRPLSMEETGTPSDQIPSLFPATAASYLELQMSGMLQSLTREQVRTVALMATDPRDKLYLAQQISRFAPNLSMVIAESDSLYGHPDYARYLQGAIVASTYPLHAVNQRWSAARDGRNERRQFANGSSEGIYNAALALLNYKQNGEPLVAGGETPALVEYGPPAGFEGDCVNNCAPPVWISVVGRNGLWPLRPYIPAEKTQGAVFKAKTSGGSHVQHAGLTTASPLFITVCLALPFITGLGWFRVRRARELEDIHATSTHEDARRYILWGLASVAIAAGFMMALGVARFRLEHTIVSGAAIALTAGVLVAVADIARRILVASAKAKAAEARQVKRERTWQMRVFRSVLAAATVWGIANLGVYAWSSTMASPTDLVAYLTRAIDLGSGVSPLLPVAFLCAAGALWAAAEVGRARTPRAALTDPDVQKLVALSVHGGLDRLCPGWKYFNGPVAWAPVPFQVVAAIAVLASCLAFDPVIRPLVSVEGPAFGRFVTAALLVLQLLIALSLGQFVHLWWSTKRLLDRMASHPWVDAYQRVPPDLFPPAVFPRAPRLVDLQRLVTEVGEQMTGLRHPALPGGPPSMQYVELSKAYEREMRKAPDTFWSKSLTWPALVGVVARSCQATQVVATGWTSSGLALHPAAVEQPEASPRRAEDLVAMSMAFVIRDALARLWHNLIFITGGAVLVFCSHALYPFQPQRHVAAIGWSYFALVCAAVVVVLVQIRRNPIISRLISATPDERKTWDAALVIKLAVFGLVPLLTLFAAQFPDLGAVVLRWIEPVQKALP